MISTLARPTAQGSAEPDVEELTTEKLEVFSITVPRYHVLLHDDDDHSYEYVINMIMRLFGHPPERAFDMAQTVDAQGTVILDTTLRERAELKRDQIHAYGADPRIAHCLGSMSASIEQAD